MSSLRHLVQQKNDIQYFNAALSGLAAMALFNAYLALTKARATQDILIFWDYTRFWMLNCNSILRALILYKY